MYPYLRCVRLLEDLTAFKAIRYLGSFKRFFCCSVNFLGSLFAMLVPLSGYFFVFLFLGKPAFILAYAFLLIVDLLLGLLIPLRFLAFMFAYNPFLAITISPC